MDPAIRFPGLACQSLNVGVTSKSHTRPEPSKTQRIEPQPDNTLLAKACRDPHSMSAMDSSSEPPRKLQLFSFDIVTRYNKKASCETAPAISEMSGESQLINGKGGWKC